MGSHRQQAMKSSVDEEETTFVKYADDAQIQASRKLVVDLRNMVNNAEWSDVVFVCKDGKHVHGYRMVLAVRCTVLHRMLTNGMAESSLSNIKLPEISSPVLLSIFEFLYTGSVVKYPPKDCRTAFEIIRAVRFLFIDHLEAIMWKFLWEQVSAQRVLTGEAPEMLNVAMELEPLRDQTSSNIILPKLVEIMNSVLLESSMLWDLSEEAFSYFLPKTTGDKDLGVLEEYAKLRLLIMWHATQRNPLLDQGERDVIDVLFPVPTRRIITFFKAPTNVDIIQGSETSAHSFWRRNDKVGILLEAESPEEYLKSLLPDENSRDIAARLLQLLGSEMWLSMINLQQIPPLLLLKVVEPLKIFRPQALKDALNLNSHLVMPMVMPKYAVEHSDSFAQIGEGLFIEKSGTASGYVTAVMRLCPPIMRETWSIVITIDYLSHDFLEVGLVHALADSGDTKLQLRGGTRLSKQSYVTFVRWERGQTSTHKHPLIDPGQSNRRDKVGAGSTVVFTFEGARKICHIDFNGSRLSHSCEVHSWGVYPAVCLHGGCVRLQLKKGFKYVL